MKPLLITILIVATGGLLFSGYLTYRELFTASPAASCVPIGEPGSILGVPPCVYGFVMYLAIATAGAIALIRGRAATR